MSLALGIVATFLAIGAIAFFGCVLQKDFSAYAASLSYAAVAVSLTVLAVILYFAGPASARPWVDALSFIVVVLLVLFAVLYGVAEKRKHN